MANKCKYFKLVRQVSYNSGQTWSNVDPPQYQQGDLYESGSTDCGDTPTPTGTTIYRWVDSQETICSGSGLYNIAYKQVSYDGGTTWEYVIPYETSIGGISEEVSCDCVEQLTTNVKFYGIDINGRTIEASCKRQSYDGGETWEDVPSELTRSEVKGGSGLLYNGAVGACVNRIGTMAFADNSHLVGVNLLGSLREIGDKAFLYCDNLKCISIPNGVERIEDGAFFGCGNIEEITIPDSVTYIGGCSGISESNDFGVFGNCTSLKSITLSSGMTIISCNMFQNCTSLTSITIPSSVLAIGSFAFYGDSGLTSITIPSSVTYIGMDAFEHTNLTSITIPNSVRTLVGGAFSDTPITSVTIENGADITFTGYNHFARCQSLVVVTIPEGISEIGESMFTSCASLESITLPSTINRIKDWAFDGCGSNQSHFTVTIAATTPPTLGFHAFPSPQYFELKIYVPSANVYDYKSADGWSDYANYIYGY